VEQDDTPDNNMFFQKAWTDVTEDEIEELAVKLESEMGGWVFHEPVNFDKKTPHIIINTKQPAIMLEKNDGVS
tara:strand:- start:332 stop:550 length:219 start_codon:yes stop_codon:yes gene_type:complete